MRNACSLCCFMLRCHLEPVLLSLPTSWNCPTASCCRQMGSILKWAYLQSLQRVPTTRSHISISQRHRIEILTKINKSRRVLSSQTVSLQSSINVLVLTECNVLCCVLSRSSCGFTVNRNFLYLYYLYLIFFKISLILFAVHCNV